jgi:hypothetical protein
VRFCDVERDRLGTWVPGSRYTASAVLLIDVIAIAGVDAFLRGGNARLWRARRSAPALLLIAGLIIGWGSSFRYDNARSGSAPWSRTYHTYERALSRQHGLSAGRHLGLRLG